MRNTVVVLWAIGIFGVYSPPLWAGGILNKSNLSADYFRSMTRHGSTDAIDIVAYNPAGVMKMANGFYTKMDLLYINKDYSNNVPNYLPTAGENGDFNSNEPSQIPGFFSVYKKDAWAAFFAVTVPGGGGKVIYNDGNARTSILGANFITSPAFGGAYIGIDNMSIEADGIDMGYTLGGAYEINEMFSVSGGLRFIDARQNFKGQVDLTTMLPVTDIFRVDLERTATGWGYFFGLNAGPTNDLNIGLLYQSNTALDYKSDVTEDSSPGQLITNGVGWPDGSKEREDLPGLLGLGVSYRILPALRLEVDYTRYLESNAKLEANRFDDAGDSEEAALSITYTFSPQWRASIGYMYTDVKGMNSTDLLPEAPELDAKTIGLGAVYSLSNRLDITFGYADVNYDAVTTDVTSSRAPASSELTKDIWVLCFGVQYRWF